MWEGPSHCDQGDPGPVGMGCVQEASEASMEYKPRYESLGPHQLVTESTTSLSKLNTLRPCGLSLRVDTEQEMCCEISIL